MGVLFLIILSWLGSTGSKLVWLGAFHNTFRTYVPLEAANAEWIRAHSDYLQAVYELGQPAATAVFLACA